MVAPDELGQGSTMRDVLTHIAAFPASRRGKWVVLGAWVLVLVLHHLHAFHAVSLLDLSVHIVAHTHFQQIERSHGRSPSQQLLGLGVEPSGAVLRCQLASIGRSEIGFESSPLFLDRLDGDAVR